MDRGKIKDYFQYELNLRFDKNCFSNIQFLQLRSVNLPNLFEQSIQESEVKKQDIQKAQAEQNKVKIEIDTKIKAAEYQKNVIINKAEGEAQAIIKQNEAYVDALLRTQNTQTNAFKNLKDTLQLTNENLLDFMKTKIIKEYSGDNDITLNIEKPNQKKEDL